MINFIVADDFQARREAIRDLLKSRIRQEIGEDALGIMCADPNETLRQIAKLGTDLRLVVLDIDSENEALGGGVRVLNEMPREYRRLVVVFSGRLAKMTREGRTVRDELAIIPDLTAGQIVDVLSGSAARSEE